MSSNDRVTGKRKAKLLIVFVILAVVFAAVLSFFIFVIPSSPNPNVRQAKQTKDAGGSARPTFDELRTGEPPEKAAEARARDQFEQSLGLSDKDRAKRESAQIADNTKQAVQKERVAKNVQLGGEGILADLEKASVAPLIGTSSVERDAKTGEVVLAPEVAHEVPYMPLRLRKALASEKSDSNGKNDNGGKSEGKPGSSDPMGSSSDSKSPMTAYEEPKFEDAASAKTSADGQSTSGDPSQSGGRIPVNIIPPMTVPIPARFEQNFIVVGTGADTGQRIVVKVQQDVVHRHRVQLPKECVFIGTTGGTRDLDLVDVEFDTVQFPDGTQVACKARAYQPYDPAAPDSWGMRGVIGEYEEPPYWSQFAPILLAGAKGYATSNLDRLSCTGIKVEGNTDLNVQTSNKDRLYGAISSSASKTIDLIMQNISRYRPRVRIRAGQPLIILLDDYLDVSKRDLMGFTDPLKQAPKKETSSGSGAPASEPPVAVDQDAMKKVLSQADPSQLSKISDFLRGGSGTTATSSSPSPSQTKLGKK